MHVRGVATLVAGVLLVAGLAVPAAAAPVETGRPSGPSLATAPNPAASAAATTPGAAAPAPTVPAAPAPAAPAPAPAPQALRRGSSGPEVLELQQRLVDHGYWLGAVDGSFGPLTQQAVIAFQKVHGLGRDGVVGPITRGALDQPAGPGPRSVAGLTVEIDKTRQVLMLVRDGRAEWIFNTSTGNGQTYLNADGDRRIASTPAGSFTVSRQIDGLRVSDLGELWRPKYFNGGIAVHGSASVPAYPASHGCVRLSNAAINWVWDTGQIPIGTPVLVY